MSAGIGTREAYRAISLYAPKRAPCALDLSDNTNLWGLPPAASAALRNVAADDVVCLRTHHHVHVLDCTEVGAELRP